MKSVASIPITIKKIVKYLHLVPTLSNDQMTQDSELLERNKFFKLSKKTNY